MRLKSLISILHISRWRGVFAHLRHRGISYSTVIYSPIRFTAKFIQTGQNVIIFKNCRIEGVPSYEGICYKPNIILQNGVSIQQNSHITCAECIEIGENTAIASNVTITDIDHPYQDIAIPIERQKLKTKPVKIGRDCKVYNNAVILQGSVIGNHCVVGANSVVKGIFPDYSIIVGTPARIVKRYDLECGQWRNTNPDGSFK